MSIYQINKVTSFQVIGNRSLSKSPQVLDYAIKAKVPSNKNNLDDSNLVPERDVSTTSNNNETASQDQSNSTPGQLVSNVVVGEDSGFQILSSKDEEAEREKPRKVISTKIYKNKKPIKAIHDHRKDDLSQNLEKAKKLLDVKAAIEKLKLRTSVESDGEGSDLSSSTSSSSGSSSSTESDSEIAIGNMNI